jgi:hypothetical protein
LSAVALRPATVVGGSASHGTATADERRTLRRVGGDAVQKQYLGGDGAGGVTRTATLTVIPPGHVRAAQDARTCTFTLSANAAVTANVQ